MFRIIKMKAIGEQSFDLEDVSEREGVKRAYLLQEFYIWKEWKEKGRNIFHFSENITDLLKQTDVL